MDPTQVLEEYDANSAQRLKRGGSALDKREWEITWKDYLTIGIPEMDAEHEKFILRVNQLNRAVIEAKDKMTVRRAMELMLTEAAIHFGHEQELLAKLEYPETAAHAAKHAELAAQIGRAMREFDEAEFSFVWAVKGLRLKQLLVEHLLKEDLKYRSFLQSRQEAREGLTAYQSGTVP